MKITRRLAVRCAGIAAATLLVAGIIAPFIHADRFAGEIRTALERSIHRDVEIGQVRFNLLTGPGFNLRRVVIHEDPAIGIEPVAYVPTLRANVRFWSLWTGRLEFSSVSLEDASINLVKTEAGRWNFEPLLGRAELPGVPAIRVRSGRINFKFGDLKSTFYLINATADLTPPSREGRPWQIAFEVQPSRSDRAARGFGNLRGNGRWSISEGPNGGLAMDVQLDENALADISSLIYGYDAGVHGELSTRLRLAGPLNEIGVNGTLEVRDVHRWDLVSPGDGGLQMRVSGRIDALNQRIELDAKSAAPNELPVTARFRAFNYLSDPRWAVSMTWKRFPVEPLVVLARHMGVPSPGGLKLRGWVQGVIGYSGEAGLKGELGFQEATLEIPDSAPLRFEEAHLVFERTKVNLLPASVLTAQEERATLTGSWDAQTGALEIGISTDSMQLEALRGQARLAAIPWLEQFVSGQWSGSLRYRNHSAQGEWTGKFELEDATLPLPGLASPLVIKTASARIAGARVTAERMRLAAGEVEATGDYRYEPGAIRPHRFRLSFDELDSADLERLLMPTFRRSGGLLARALRIGRVPVPAWLRERRMEGSVQISKLTVAGFEFERVHSPVVWETTSIGFPDLRGHVGKARLTGSLLADVRGASPEYRLRGKWHGVGWQSGSVNGEVELHTRGTGAELLGNLRAAGDFELMAPEFEALPPVKSIQGAYLASWNGTGPSLTLSALQLELDGDTYIGRGFTTGDGRLIVQFSSGLREFRMSGTLAKLQMDEPTAR